MHNKLFSLDDKLSSSASRKRNKVSLHPFISCKAWEYLRQFTYYRQIYLDSMIVKVHIYFLPTFQTIVEFSDMTHQGIKRS